MSTTSQISSLATRIGQEAKALWAAVNAKAPTNNPTLTGTVTLPSTTSIGNVSSTELGYVDGVTSGIQSQLNGKANSSHSHAIADTPTGSLMAYAGSTAPSGWLMCNNLPVSRTTYADLFAVIGTTYGAGDGSTTFNLPDLRGRVVAGLDAMGGAASANRIGGMTDGRGSTGGAAMHQLSVAEMPTHTHTQESTTAYDLGTQTWGANIVSGSAYKIGTKTAPQTGPAGSNSAHNNMQPTMLLNWIIKT